MGTTCKGTHFFKALEPIEALTYFEPLQKKVSRPYMLGMVTGPTLS